MLLLNITLIINQSLIKVIQAVDYLGKYSKNKGTKFTYDLNTIFNYKTNRRCHLPETPGGGYQ